MELIFIQLIRSFASIAPFFRDHSNFTQKDLDIKLDQSNVPYEHRNQLRDNITDIKALVINVLKFKFLY